MIWHAPPHEDVAFNRLEQARTSITVRRNCKQAVEIWKQTMHDSCVCSCYFKTRGPTSEAKTSHPPLNPSSSVISDELVVFVLKLMYVHVFFIFLIILVLIGLLNSVRYRSCGAPSLLHKMTSPARKGIACVTDISSGGGVGHVLSEQQMSFFFLLFMEHCSTQTHTHAHENGIILKGLHHSKNSTTGGSHSSAS